MTIEEKIKASLYPYTLPDASIEALVEDQDLDWEDDYVKDEHGLPCAKITIEALWQLVTLTKEQDSGSTQEYNVKLILDRIKRIAKNYDIPEEEAGVKPQNEDITDYW